MIPNGAIGVRRSPDGGTLYVTDVTGLGIYDVRDEDSPQALAHLPLPRAVAAGGSLLVDVSEPGRPAVRGVRPLATPGLTIYDVRDLSRPAPRPASGGEELAWITDGVGTFAFDVSDPVRPQLLLGGPGEPDCEHHRLLFALTRRARIDAWPDRGAPIGFYASAGSFWGAYLAPSDCPPLGSRCRTTERRTLSPTGESGRPASWGRGPVHSPLRPHDHAGADRVVRGLVDHDERAGGADLLVRVGDERRPEA